MCINGSLKILKGSRINGDSIGVLALGSEIIAMQWLFAHLNVVIGLTYKDEICGVQLFKHNSLLYT